MSLLQLYGLHIHTWLIVDSSSESTIWQSQCPRSLCPVAEEPLAVAVWHTQVDCRVAESTVLSWTDEEIGVQSPEVHFHEAISLWGATKLQAKLLDSVCFESTVAAK